MTRILPAALAALATLVVPFSAGAQEPAVTGAAPAWIEADDGAMSVVALGLTVDEIEDLDIVDASGTKIGEVDDALMAPDGTIGAVTAEVGGFLGAGEREVVVPLDRLEVAGGRLVTSLTRDELASLEEWDD